MNVKMATKALKLDKLLKPYQEEIIKQIQDFIPMIGPKTPLREACEYALLNGGKRIRPALVLMMGKAFGREAIVSPSALAIEFFHTASLVADDLPCMDDDDERRSKPSVHKKFGETVAILVSYALIAVGYGCYAKNAMILKKADFPHSSQSDHLCTLVLENASFNTGLKGATGGQFLDIFPGDLSLSTVRDVIHKKTVSLFEVSFVSGWLFGGGEVFSLPLVKKAAGHIGMAFQLADDLLDLHQDALNERVVNAAAIIGAEATEKWILEEIESYKQTLTQLNVQSDDLFNVIDYF
jgi:geranylgeranyl diphosphate synthase type II